MYAPENYLDFLRRLPAKDRTEEIYQELTDSLQALVRAVEQTEVAEHAHVQGCVIDDILIDHVEIGPLECAVSLSFAATAALGDGTTDRITGEAEAAFDADGQVDFRDATILKEHDYVAHEIAAAD